MIFISDINACSDENEILRLKLESVSAELTSTRERLSSELSSKQAEVDQAQSQITRLNQQARYCFLFSFSVLFYLSFVCF